MKSLIYLTTKFLKQSNSTNWLPLHRSFFLAVLVASVALSPQSRAACQQGCDIAQHNTFLGDNVLISNTSGSNNAATGALALQNNTTGSANTADGAFALQNNTTGSDNTAIGLAALMMNTTGFDNTATGMSALIMNTTGHDNTAGGAEALESNTTGSFNTASGVAALFANSTGSNNTANGFLALFNYSTGNNNTATGANALKGQAPGSGSNNTATGFNALFNNSTGSNNLANGYQALFNNSTGVNNMATGTQALFSNTTGFFNMANGSSAMFRNTTGNYNVAEGLNALYSNTTGSNNIAIGINAGGDLTTGSGNIAIGNRGVAGESRTIRIGTKGAQTNTFIAGISGVTVAGGVGVIIDTNGHLGTVVSSKRFKEEIKPMDKGSEAILSLNPVTFRYKHELDPVGIPQFGLVAEEVEKVNPDLVARDEQGKVYTVRYEAVNAMLLNEFLKEHRKVGEQEATITELESNNTKQATIIAQLGQKLKALRATVAKVSDQFELRGRGTQLATNP